MSKIDDWMKVSATRPRVDSDDFSAEVDDAGDIAIHFNAVHTGGDARGKFPGIGEVNLPIEVAMRLCDWLRDVTGTSNEV